MAFPSKRWNDSEPRQRLALVLRRLASEEVARECGVVPLSRLVSEYDEGCRPDIQISSPTRLSMWCRSCGLNVVQIIPSAKGVAIDQSLTVFWYAYGVCEADLALDDAETSKPAPAPVPSREGVQDGEPVRVSAEDMLRAAAEAVGGVWDHAGRTRLEVVEECQRVLDAVRAGESGSSFQLLSGAMVLAVQEVRA